MHSRSGRKRDRKALEGPPVDKMVRGGDSLTKGPIPEDEGAEMEGEAPSGIDAVVRDRGCWFPGDPTR